MLRNETQIKCSLAAEACLHRYDKITLKGCTWAVSRCQYETASSTADTVATNCYETLQRRTQLHLTFFYQNDRLRGVAH